MAENLAYQINSCDNTDLESKQQDQQILSKIKESLSKTKLFHIENDYMVTWNLNMTVTMAINHEMNPIKTVVVDKDGARAIDEKDVMSTRKFLRIGTVEV